MRAQRLEGLLRRFLIDLKRRHYLLHGKAVPRRGFVEEEEDEHGERRDAKLVLLRSIREGHYHDCVAKSELEVDLTTLVLVGVEAAELLEFVIYLAGHDQVVVLVCRPVCRLHALDGEVEGILLIRLLFVCHKLLSLFAHSGEICEHTLHLVELLHATDEL